MTDKAELKGVASASFEREFATLVPAATLERGTCSPHAVRLSIHLTAPERYSNALGLAYRSGQRILPRLEIYVNPVVRLMHGIRAPEAVGRALARVAAHEVAHYALQDSDHDSGGLLRERFPYRQLAGEDSAPFLLASR